ncbi:hypothetical protein PITC_085360 [Penicillium italicum]|uniref:Uncharacterized protein n=1 Tax=Penicillium italicum TaxID=40296 RepID=A0A0A2L2G4_PENIT|nr:hypothetical protein PITC_085360 [Penicillium italicum]
MQLLPEAVWFPYPMTEVHHADGEAGNAAAMARYPPAASVRIRVLIVFIMKLILRGKRPSLFNFTNRVNLRQASRRNILIGVLPSS